MLTNDELSVINGTESWHRKSRKIKAFIDRQSSAENLLQIFNELQNLNIPDPASKLSNLIELLALALIRLNTDEANRALQEILSNDLSIAFRPWAIQKPNIQLTNDQISLLLSFILKNVQSHIDSDEVNYFSLRLIRTHQLNETTFNLLIEMLKKFDKRMFYGMLNYIAQNQELAIASIDTILEDIGEIDDVKTLADMLYSLSEQPLATTEQLMEMYRLITSEIFNGVDDYIEGFLTRVFNHPNAPATILDAYFNQNQNVFLNIENDASVVEDSTLTLFIAASRHPNLSDAIFEKILLLACGSNKPQAIYSKYKMRLLLCLTRLPRATKYLQQILDAAKSFPVWIRTNILVGLAENAAISAEDLIVIHREASGLDPLLQARINHAIARNERASEDLLRTIFEQTSSLADPDFQGRIFEAIALNPKTSANSNLWKDISQLRNELPGYYQTRIMGIITARLGEPGPSNKNELSASDWYQSLWQSFSLEFPDILDLLPEDTESIIKSFSTFDDVRTYSEANPKQRQFVQRFILEIYRSILQKLLPRSQSEMIREYVSVANHMELEAILPFINSENILSSDARKQIFLMAFSNPEIRNNIALIGDVMQLLLHDPHATLTARYLDNIFLDLARTELSPEILNWILSSAEIISIHDSSHLPIVLSFITHRNLENPDSIHFVDEVLGSTSSNDIEQVARHLINNETLTREILGLLLRHLIDNQTVTIEILSLINEKHNVMDVEYQIFESIYKLITLNSTLAKQEKLMENQHHLGSLTLLSPDSMSERQEVEKEIQQRLDEWQAFKNRLDEIQKKLSNDELARPGDVQTMLKDAEILFAATDLLNWEVIRLSDDNDLEKKLEADRFIEGRENLLTRIEAIRNVFNNHEIPLPSEVDDRQNEIEISLHLDNPDIRENLTEQTQRLTDLEYRLMPLIGEHFSTLQDRFVAMTQRQEELSNRVNIPLELTQQLEEERVMLQETINAQRLLLSELDDSARQGLDFLTLSNIQNYLGELDRILPNQETAIRGFESHAQNNLRTHIDQDQLQLESILLGLGKLKNETEERQNIVANLATTIDDTRDLLNSLLERLDRIPSLSILMDIQRAHLELREDIIKDILTNAASLFDDSTQKKDISKSVANERQDVVNALQILNTSMQTQFPNAAIPSEILELQNAITNSQGDFANFELASNNADTDPLLYNMLLKEELDRNTQFNNRILELEERLRSQTELMENVLHQQTSVNNFVQISLRCLDELPQITDSQHVDTVNLERQIVGSIRDNFNTMLQQATGNLLSSDELKKAEQTASVTNWEIKQHARRLAILAILNKGNLKALGTDISNMPSYMKMSEGMDLEKSIQKTLEQVAQALENPEKDLIQIEKDVTALSKQAQDYLAARKKVSGQKGKDIVSVSNITSRLDVYDDIDSLEALIKLAQDYVSSVDEQTHENSLSLNRNHEEDIIEVHLPSPPQTPVSNERMEHPRPEILPNVSPLKNKRNWTLNLASIRKNLSNITSDLTRLRKSKNEQDPDVSISKQETKMQEGGIVTNESNLPPNEDVEQQLKTELQKKFKVIHATENDTVTGRVVLPPTESSDGALYVEASSVMARIVLTRIIRIAPEYLEPEREYSRGQQVEFKIPKSKNTLKRKGTFSGH